MRASVANSSRYSSGTCTEDLWPLSFHKSHNRFLQESAAGVQREVMQPLSLEEVHYSVTVMNWHFFGEFFFHLLSASDNWASQNDLQTPRPLLWAPTLNLTLWQPGHTKRWTLPTSAVFSLLPFYAAKDLERRPPPPPPHTHTHLPSFNQNAVCWRLLRTLSWTLQFLSCARGGDTSSLYQLSLKGPTRKLIALWKEAVARYERG